MTPILFRDALIALAEGCRPNVKVHRDAEGGSGALPCWAVALLSVLLAGDPGGILAGTDQQHAVSAVCAPGHVVGVPLVRPVAGAGGFAGCADASEQDRLAGVRAVLVADHATRVVHPAAAADRDDLAVDHSRGVGAEGVAAQDAGNVQASGAPTLGTVGGAGLGLPGGLDLAQSDGGGVFLGLAHGSLLAAVLRWCCERESNRALGLSIGFFGRAGLRPNVRDHRAGPSDPSKAGETIVAGSGASTCWADFCDKCDKPNDCHPDCPHRARK